MTRFNSADPVSCDRTNGGCLTVRRVRRLKPPFHPLLLESPFAPVPRYPSDVTDAEWALLRPEVQAVMAELRRSRAPAAPRYIPAERLRSALQFARTAPTIGAAKRIRGLTLVASDLDWTAGKGPSRARRGPAHGHRRTPRHRPGTVRSRPADPRRPRRRLTRAGAGSCTAQIGNTRASAVSDARNCLMSGWTDLHKWAIVRRGPEGR
jgi:hypothetical protein